MPITDRKYVLLSSYFSHFKALGLHYWQLPRASTSESRKSILSAVQVVQEKSAVGLDIGTFSQSVAFSVVHQNISKKYIEVTTAK